MALLDLSLVTKVLVEMLKAHISQSPAWPFAAWGAPVVTGQPPDQLAAGSLGVYLYHVTEDAHLKNQPPNTSSVPPVRFTPMGLSLHYQVSALGNGSGDQATLQEQTLVGCAVKALHDFPVVTDNTLVPRRPPQAALPVLQSVGLDGDGNELRIAMQPVAYHEASSFWSAGSLVPRLALYYEVSVVLLRPEKPPSLSSRVLQVGIQTFVGGSPRLDSSENSFVVRVPGLDPQTMTARPAEVAVGSRVDFLGYNFSGPVRLILQSLLWPAPVTCDSAWGVTASPDRVFATVQPAADGQAVVPGVYSARVSVEQRRVLPDGTSRSFEVLSNATPLSISARIDTLTMAGDLGTITGGPFAPPDPSVPAFPADSVQLCVGDALLTSLPTAVPPATSGPGEFTVASATTVTFRLPTGLLVGTPVPVRLFVLGAESIPVWVTP